MPEGESVISRGMCQIVIQTFHERLQIVIESGDLNLNFTYCFLC